MKSRNKLTEEQIRPKKLKKINEDKNRIDLNFLLKRKKRFVKVSCPACQSKKYKNYLKKNHLSYLICIKCKTFYVSPRPSEKLLEEFYKQSKVYKFFNDYIFPKTEKIRYSLAMNFMPVGISGCGDSIYYYSNDKFLNENEPTN